jgi:regulator of RNase E activity RraA
MMKQRIAKRTSDIDAMIREIRMFPCAAIADCLQRFFVVTSEITAISSRYRFCGPIFPIQEYEGSSSTIHLALTHVPAGHIVMINGRGYRERAIWGAVLNRAAAERSVAAVLIDGAVRDVTALKRSKFPVYARSVTPAGPTKGGIGVINESISFGGVPVSPGDIAVGDADGIVVVPKKQIRDITEACRKKMREERQWLRYIDHTGMTPLGAELRKA